MDTFAYDHNLPCKNPNCNSYGKPHPNCKCYGAHAEGGDIKHFCDSKMPHQSSCEYFEGGGMAGDPIDYDSMEDLSDAPKPQPGPTPQPAGFENMEDLSDRSPTLSRIEGAVTGLAGPLAPGVSALENQIGTEIPGLDLRYESQGRRAQTPEFGQGQIVGNAVQTALLLSNPVVRGAGILGQALTAMLNAGGDEARKYMTNQDPNRTFADSIARGALDAAIVSVTHGVFRGTAKGLDAISEALPDKLRGLAWWKWATSLPDSVKNSPEFLAELDKINPRIVPTIKSLANIEYQKQNIMEWAENQPTLAKQAMDYAVKGAKKGIGVDNFASNFLGKQVRKRALPLLIKMFNSGSLENMADVLEYGETLHKNSQLINNAVEGIFSAGARSSMDDYASDIAKAAGKVSDWIDAGGPKSQLQQEINAMPSAKYADGGDVLNSDVLETPDQPTVPDFIKQLAPEQAMALNATQARMYNYLNALRPAAQQAAIFDEPQKNMANDKEYNEALKIAARPLTIMNKVRNGTITNTSINHLVGMYPELHSELSKELTKRITKAKMAGEKPSYKLRQGMSMFLGAPLDSSFLPQNMMATQAIFAGRRMAQQQAAQTAPSKPKKSKDSLSKLSEAHMTPEQAAEARLSKA